MTAIPPIIKVRAIQGGVVGAIAPWLISLLFLFIAKLFLSALLGIKEFLIFGGAAVAGFLAHQNIRDPAPGPRLIGAGVVALVVGGLVSFLMELCKKGLYSLNQTIDSATASFAWFLFIGGMIGAAVGALLGYIEHERGSPFSIFSPRQTPRIITINPPPRAQGLGHNPNISERDAFTQEPLNASRPIYQCGRCQAQYYEATLRNDIGNRCANPNCGNTHFERVA